MTYTQADRCRSCGEVDLFAVLDLGEQPLANSFRRPEDYTPEPRYPLAVVGCPTCSLVQLSGTVDPKLHFDSYAYFSSYSTTMVSEMGRLAANMVKRAKLTESSLVLEVASNDGYLLKHYIALGVRTLGIEPARNVAEVAVARGVPTWCEYFSPTVAARVVSECGRADVVHANNVLAHVPDLLGFLEGIRVVMAPDGVAVIETPHLPQMIAKAEFDTIYHEHVFYFSVSAFEYAAKLAGLAVCDVEEVDRHGGSVRMFLRANEAAESERVTALLARERNAGVDKPDFYQTFAGRVETLRLETVSLLQQLRDSGYRVAAYGAAAKGTVLLNHFGIGPDLIDVVVDRNEHKQGLLMPGVRIPIDDPRRLEEDQPDYLLLLAWNLRDEIVAQQEAYRKRGGQFIVPIPCLEVIS